MEEAAELAAAGEEGELWDEKQTLLEEDEIATS